MRLVLSRKGFDSGYGGCASPVLPDGRMVSLPIPSARSARCYGDLAWDGGCLGDAVHALTGGRVSHRHHAHLDPDLSSGAMARMPGWRPAFGQEKAAQSHLASRGVGPGDLFLFFGWFRRAEEAPGSGLRHVRGAPDMHALFGWLQVGEVLAVGAALEAHRGLRPWLADHPHLVAHGAPGNTVYLASERLVLDGRDMGAPGGGAFRRFHDGLRLTKEGRTRTVWDVPGWMLPEDGPAMSYHGDPARWEREGDRCVLKTVAKGQEFVSEPDEASLAAWMRDLLAGAA